MRKSEITIRIATGEMPFPLDGQRVSHTIKAPSLPPAHRLKGLSNANQRIVYDLVHEKTEESLLRVSHRCQSTLILVLQQVQLYQMQGCLDSAGWQTLSLHCRCGRDTRRAAWLSECPKQPMSCLQMLLPSWNHPEAACMPLDHLWLESDERIHHTCIQKA